MNMNVKDEQSIQKNHEDKDEFRNKGSFSYACKFCFKTFKAQTFLDVHMRVHTGERPYSCEVCSKSFTQKGHLKAHRRLHTGEKPFPCTLCSRSFRQKGQLKSHFKIHTGEKSFQCSVCPLKFRLKSILENHMRTCIVSERGFKRKGNLSAHTKTNKNGSNVSMQEVMFTSNDESKDISSKPKKYKERQILGESSNIMTKNKNEKDDNTWIDDEFCATEENAIEDCPNKLGYFEDINVDNKNIKKEEQEIMKEKVNLPEPKDKAMKLIKKLQETNKVSKAKVKALELEIIDVRKDNKSKESVITELKSIIEEKTNEELINEIEIEQKANLLLENKATILKYKKELADKDQEITKMKEEFAKIKIIKEKRRGPVIDGAKKMLTEYNSERCCKSCDINKVECEQCVQYFDNFLYKMESEGFLKKMSDKLIETDNRKAKIIILDLLANLVNYRPKMKLFKS